MQFVFWEQPKSGIWTNCSSSKKSCSSWYRDKWPQCARVFNVQVQWEPSTSLFVCTLQRRKKTFAGVHAIVVCIKHMPLTVICIFDHCWMLLASLLVGKLTVVSNNNNKFISLLASLLLPYVVQRTCWQTDFRVSGRPAGELGWLSWPATVITVTQHYEHFWDFWHINFRNPECTHHRFAMLHQFPAV